LCALPLDSVREVTFCTEGASAPTMPFLIAGIMNYEGEPVPMIRLAHVFGLKCSDAELYSPLVMVRDSGRLVAMQVDDVPGAARAEESTILPVPENHTFQNCAVGSMVWRDAPVVILHPERILTEKERQCADFFRAMEEHRLRALETVPR